MAFRKKFEKVIQLNPDVLVIQECENISKLANHLSAIHYNQLLWFGNNPHKGIAVISFNAIEIELNQSYNPAFEYIIPIQLMVNKKEINLFCIWAMPHKTERAKRYVGQIWGAINHYKDLLSRDSILIGDFNSNAIWDGKSRIASHSDVVTFLNQRQIFSIYHKNYEIKHGEEKHPTLFLLKKEEKPYHLDYCFASRSLFSKNSTFEIGIYRDWIKLSDHMPIIIDNLHIA